VKVSGAPTVELGPQPTGEDTMHDEHWVPGVEPMLVPENITSQIDEEQEMVFAPLFLRVIEMAEGAAVEPVPATMDAPTTMMLEFEVALLTRLYTEALTIPPTPRTAAIMMNRSMLCDMASRFLLTFIDRKPEAAF
jgi:hypothetical protein